MQTRINTKAITALLTIALFPRAVLADSELSARELLAKAAESVSWADHAHIKSEIESRPWDKGSAVHPYFISTDIYSSGNQLHSVWYVLGNDGRVAIRWDLLLTPERRLLWTSRNGQSTVNYSESPALIHESMGFDRAQAGGFFLDGAVPDNVYYRFDLSTAAQFGKVDSIVRDDQLTGLACRVVHVIGDHWEMRIWVVPSRGFNFAKYTFDRSPVPGRPSEYHSVLVDNISYRQMPGQRWVIQGGSCETRWADGKGTNMRFRDVARRTEIDLSPDFVKVHAFDLPRIPDGTRIWCEDVDRNGEFIRSPRPYFWLQGHVVVDFGAEIVSLMYTPIIGGDSNLNLAGCALFFEPLTCWAFAVP